MDWGTNPHVQGRLWDYGVHLLQDMQLALLCVGTASSTCCQWSVDQSIMFFQDVLAVYNTFLVKMWLMWFPCVCADCAAAVRNVGILDNGLPLLPTNLL